MKNIDSKVFAVVLYIVALLHANNRDEHFSIYVHPFSTLIFKQLESSLYWKSDLQIPINDRNKIVGSYAYYSFKWQDCEEKSFCSLVNARIVEDMTSFQDYEMSVGWQRPFFNDFDIFYYQQMLHLTLSDSIGINSTRRKYDFGMSILTGTQFSINYFSMFCDFGPLIRFRDNSNPDLRFSLNFGLGMRF